MTNTNNRWILATGVLVTLSGCGTDEQAPEDIASVQVLHAVPSVDMADVQLLGGQYPATGLAFAETAAFEAPTGAHQIDLVAPIAAAGPSDCRLNDDEPPCAAPAQLAGILATLTPGSDVLIVFSERWGANREGFELELNREAADSGDTSTEVRFVHAMPEVATVSISGVGGNPPAFGFLGVSRQVSAPTTGLELGVTDAEGSELFETSVAFDGLQRRWTVALVGDGSDAAPYQAVPIAG